MAPTSALSPLLVHANAVVQGLAADTAKEAPEDAVQQLKSIVFAITSAGRHNKKLTSDEQTAIWKLVCILWVGLAATLHFRHGMPEAASLFQLFTQQRTAASLGYAAGL